MITDKYIDFKFLNCTKSNKPFLAAKKFTFQHHNTFFLNTNLISFISKPKHVLKLFC